MIKTEITQHLLKKTLGLTLAFSAAAMAFAQQQSLPIQGSVIDAAGDKIPYASITFTSHDNTAYSDGTMTDENGAYNLSIHPGNYTIKIEAPGFATQEFTRSISQAGLQPNLTIQKSATSSSNVQEIEGVTITKIERPYKVELDKKVYDVSSDLTTIGGNLQDVLENVPSVNVDPDGTVSIRGNSNVKFLVNGKPSAMLGLDSSADALRAFSADQIERIEVVTNPSAKYEATGTGGILNIILKKSKKMGFNGTVTGSLGYMPRTNLNANLNWKRGNWMWFVNGGGGYRKSKETDTNFMTRKEDPTDIDLSAFPFIKTSDQIGHEKSEGSHYNISAGLVYDINEKTSINFSGTARLYDSNRDNLNTYREKTYQNATDFTNIYRERGSLDDSKRTTAQIDAGLDHKFNDKGHKISIAGNFRMFNSEGNTKITQNSFIDSQLQDNGNSINNVNTDSKSKSFLGKVDYELPLGEKSKFEAGARYDYNRNNYDYFVNQSDDGGPIYTRYDFTSDTQYSEDVLGVYAQFRSEIGDHFTYQLGLRSETSSINVNFNNFDENGNPDYTSVKKSYTKFFPSVFLGYKLDRKNQILLNYSRRIRRPRAFSLIPFFSFNDDRNYFRGNPNLNPEYQNSFELGYSYTAKKLTFNPTLYYRKSEDEMQRYRYMDENGAINSLPINAGSSQSYGLDMNGTYNPVNWWKLMLSANFYGYNNKGQYNIFPDNPNTLNDFSGKGFSYRFRLNTTFNPTKTLSLQLQGFYRAGEESVSSDRKPMYGMNFGATQRIWDGKGTLALSIRDVFNSRKFKSRTETAQFIRESEFQWSPRSISLSLTYNFQKGDKFKTQKKQMNELEGEGGGRGEI